VVVTAGGNGLQTQGVCKACIVVISPGRTKTTTTTTASLSFAHSTAADVGGGITIGGGGVSPRGWNTQTGLPTDGCSTVTEITPGGAKSCYSLSWRRRRRK